MGVLDATEGNIKGGCDAGVGWVRMGSKPINKEIAVDGATGGISRKALPVHDWIREARKQNVSDESAGRANQR